MPDFFPFIPGTETSRAARQHASEASPLLGRFRAVPRRRSQGNHNRQRGISQLGLISAGGRGSVHVGYGALVAAGLEDDSDSDSEDYDSDEEEGAGAGWRWRLRRLSPRKVARVVRKNVQDLWVAPRQNAVKKVVESWWRRWGLLVFLPAGLVSLLLRVY